jgi:hypothetical protein
VSEWHFEYWDFFYENQNKTNEEIIMAFAIDLIFYELAENKF